jgi:hypothetical protein
MVQIKAKDQLELKSQHKVKDNLKERIKIRRKKSKIVDGGELTEIRNCIRDFARIRGRKQVSVVRIG